VQRTVAFLFLSTSFSVYRSDWPLLIVCPSSLRLNWRDELLKWLQEDIDVDEINVVMKGADCLRRLDAVNIVSYDLVQKIPVKEIDRCNFMICDESHYLKTKDTKRSKFLTPLIRKMRRALLLSGTPALSRPVELFPQVNALEPELFPNYRAFTSRYCNGHMTRFGYDVSGSANLDELHKLLRGSCLIRRKKEDVLTQLPPKQRQVIWVETKPSVMKDVAKAHVELRNARAALEENGLSESDLVRCKNAERSASNKLYTLTGEAKVDAITQYLKDALDCTQKVIVFGHHIDVLAAIDEYVRTKLKVSTIKIDGATPQHLRQALCTKFQTDPTVRVAVLSITAAGVGLTLTAASMVVFAELYFNPGSLLQAEDRAHRIGQRDCVMVKYLLAHGTIDDSMWDMVHKKLTIVGKSLTGIAATMPVNQGGNKRKRGEGTMDAFVICDRSDDDDDDITDYDGGRNSVGPDHKSNGLSGGNGASNFCDDKLLSSPQKGDNLVVLDDESDIDFFPIDYVSASRARAFQTLRRQKSEKIEVYDADLALARKLQRQFDAEDVTAAATRP
jgi:SWI/SNF-related matrix-associated actin-dependent regulator of chromatin subfamily A-like protein 1